MTEDLQYVGGNYPVHDVAQKVTGELVYGSDFSVPGMLHAKLILSTIPHGNVKRIDASRAEALPGVVKVFSHENSPMDTFCRARIHPGQDLAMHDETLFSERVRFVGDRVAAVVATSRAIAEAAAALVEVEYEELPRDVDDRRRSGPGRRSPSTRSATSSMSTRSTRASARISRARWSCRRPPPRRACITRRWSPTSASPRATAPAA